MKYIRLFDTTTDYNSIKDNLILPNLSTCRDNLKKAYFNSKPKSQNVEPVEPTLLDINPSVSIDGWTYGGTASEPSVSGNLGNGTVTYYYKLQSSNEWSSTKPSDAGYYDIKADISATANYNSGTCSNTFTISKANSTYTAPTSKSNLVYNGEAQELVNAGSTNDGTFKYSLDDFTWSIFIPTGTNVNSYDVYWKLEGDSNHNDASSTLNNITIAKANITPYVTISGWAYGGTASEPSVSGNLGNGTVTYYYKLQSSNEWSSTKPSDIGDYDIKADISATDNYNSGTCSNTFTISKANPTYTAPTPKSNLVYNGEAQELVNAGSTNDGIIKYSLDNSTWSTSIPTSTNANSYNVYWKLEGDSDHNDVSSTLINVTITKANITPYVTISNWTYGSTASEPLVSGNPGNGNITYFYKLQSSSSWSSTKPSDAGDYDIKANVESTSNYNSGTATNTFTINKVTPTVTAPTAKVLTYNGSAQELINAGSTNYGTLKYSLDGIANLPYDSEVEYLSGDGHQFINTGIVPDSSTGIKVTCRPDVNNYINNESNDMYIVGLRDNSSNTRWCLGKAGSSDWGKAGVYYGYGTYGYFGQSEYDDDRYYPYGTTFTLSLNFLNSKYAVNGERDSISLPSTMPFTATNVIRIFGSSGVTGNYTKYAGKIYSVQISQGNNIIMDLIPVRVGNVGYMYDKISGNLYGNNGTSTFGYGADVSVSTVRTYSTSIPTATDAGSYTVYYKVEGNSNVNSVAEASIQCSIAENNQQ